jgi:hypothetical protein
MALGASDAFEARIKIPEEDGRGVVLDVQNLMVRMG